jgi:signal peptide peptidase SppA
MEADSTYLLGYQELSQRFEAALADPSASAIVLNCDSPGGEVSGCFELAEQIYSARGKKPIHASVSSLAASAAYAVASAADSISITQTAAAGSIGVVMRHVDMSKMLKKDGVSVTHIFAGAHKVDGNPYEPLPKDVQARFQGEIDTLYDMFVDTVARHRGMDRQAVINTEADIFMGQAAIDRGLADKIETPDQLITRLAAAGRANPQQGAFMSTAAKPAPAAEQPDTITQAQHDSAVAAARTEGASAERARIAGILTHEAATARPALARQLALNSDMTIEQAGKTLAACPIEGMEIKGESEFSKHMSALGNDDIGPDAAKADESQAIDASWSDAFTRAGV